MTESKMPDTSRESYEAYLAKVAEVEARVSAWARKTIKKEKVSNAN
jgi:hypothetical protein